MISINVLGISYAFPPLQVPMSQVTYKYILALKNAGVNVDIVTADSSAFPHFKYDYSLDNHIKQNFDNKIFRIPLNNKSVSNIFYRYTKYMTDPMYIFQDSLCDFLKNINLQTYDSVITFTPFHSVNIAVNELKKTQSFKWIIHFCDPWYMNPLEDNILRRLYSYFYERSVLRNCDGVVHTCNTALELMFKNHPFVQDKKNILIPHTFIQDLYPQKKIQNDTIVIRHIGTLYKHRSPETLFLAVNKLAKIIPNLNNYIRLELIGPIATEIRQSKDYLQLQDIIHIIEPVDYLQSLMLCYNADILLLIENNFKTSLFFPSKLSDYIGSGSYIIGLVPDGISRNILTSMNLPCVYPDDVDNLVKILFDKIKSEKREDLTLKSSSDLNSNIVGLNYANYLKSL